MKKIEFDITSYNDDFPILAFFNKVNGVTLSWKLTYLYCVGNDTSDIDILSLENKINNSSDGLYMSGFEVLEILSNIYQVYDITMTAMNRNEELFILEVIDGGFVSLTYKDSWIIDKINMIVNSMS